MVGRLVSALQFDEPIELELADLGRRLYRINSERGAENWCQTERLLDDLKMIETVERARAVEDALKRLESLKGKDFYKLEHLSSEDVREMSACPLVTIGAHSNCHSILTRLSDEDLLKSVKSSKLLLQEWTGFDVPYFSYSHGQYNDRVIEALKAEDFGCGLTTESRAWGRPDSVFAIPRVGIGRYDYIDIFKVQVSGGIRNFFNSIR